MCPLSYILEWFASSTSSIPPPALLSPILTFIYPSNYGFLPEAFPSHHLWLSVLALSSLWRLVFCICLSPQSVNSLRVKTLWTSLWFCSSNVSKLIRCLLIHIIDLLELLVQQKQFLVFCDFYPGSPLHYPIFFCALIILYLYLPLSDFSVSYL